MSRQATRAAAGAKPRAMAGLKPRQYYVLLALTDDPRHGLAIARDAEQLSEGRVRLWPAMLYGSVDELIEYGWIAETSPPSADESERKRFYQLIRAGRRVLTAETERLAGLVKVARARLKRAGGAT
jgi:DNA-binding PadR family transcriptional regulator